jgi:hypothetical protein
VPLGIYKPPWCYPLSSVVDEVGYHLTYGAALGATYEASRRARRVVEHDDTGRCLAVANDVLAALLEMRQRPVQNPRG